MKKKKKARLTKGEKVLYFFAVVSLCVGFMTEIFAGALYNDISMEVEEKKNEITDQQKKIESLNMQINELTSFDTIKEVVENIGLSYNNDNIIIING